MYKLTYIICLIHLTMYITDYWARLFSLLINWNWVDKLKSSRDKSSILFIFNSHNVWYTYMKNVYCYINASSVFEFHIFIYFVLTLKKRPTYCNSNKVVLKLRHFNVVQGFFFFFFLSNSYLFAIKGQKNVKFTLYKLHHIATH